MPRNGGVSFIRSCVFFGFAGLRRAGCPLTVCWRETGLPLTRHGVRQQRSGARRNRAFVIVEDNDRKKIGVERRKDDRNTTIWHKRYSAFWGHLLFHPAAVLSCRQDQDASLIHPRRFGEW